jgi:integrase
LNAAVRAWVLGSNPCHGSTVTAYPRGGDGLPHATGVSAAAGSHRTCDADAKTCRINKAWKYSGDYRPEIGPPKTKKSIRTISLPPAALDVIDLTAPGFLFTNGAGNPARAQEFFNGGWKPGRDSAMRAGLTKSPRVEDLRHTSASWMIQAGVPLPVIQQHLGHDSIQTIIGLRRRRTQEVR